MAGNLAEACCGSRTLQGFRHVLAVATIRVIKKDDSVRVLVHNFSEIGKIEGEDEVGRESEVER